jgi:16S rRNA (uracil1498-N3)-methyltransferase
MSISVPIIHTDIFYVPPSRIFGGTLQFPESEAHHIHRVLRKKRGDVVQVVDGEGATHDVEITELSRSTGSGKILKTRRCVAEPVAELVVAQAVIKGERFDWFVEKATEIGIRKIIPLICERSQVQASSQKLARWRRIAIAAMKQSGRSRLPVITGAMDMSHAIAVGSSFQCKIIAHNDPEAVPFHPAQKETVRTTVHGMILIGPESGFTDEEVVLARGYGYRTLTLGPRRLRSETAGLVLSSLLMWHLGELE